MNSPIAVILNGSAGSDGVEEIRKRIDSLFLSSGFEASIHVAEEGGKVVEFASKAIRDGARAVVAGGGDGTVSAVASVVAGTGRPLGVLPAGTLNHFAKDLGIPLDLEEAARTVIRGAVQSVDAAEVNGRMFINNSSIGIYPRLVTARERHERMGASRLTGIVRAAVEGLRKYSLLTVRLNADGKELVRRTPFIFIGNNLYKLEGFDFGTRESLTEGELCLAVAHRTSRAGLVRLAFHALREKLREARDVDMLRAKSIVVETPLRSVRVALDGEVYVMEPPLRYTIRPAALNVIVPAAAGSRSFES